MMRLLNENIRFFRVEMKGKRNVAVDLSAGDQLNQSSGKEFD